MQIIVATEGGYRTNEINYSQAPYILGMILYTFWSTKEQANRLVGAEALDGIRQLCTDGSVQFYNDAAGVVRFTEELEISSAYAYLWKEGVWYLYVGGTTFPVTEAVKL